jgi:hypothetical protein
VPPGGGRSIGEIVPHIGMCYLMYENQAFGDRSRQWGDGQIEGGPRPQTQEEWTAWLRSAHRIFRDSVAALTDDQLDDLVYAPWGDQLPAWRIVELMIQHGTYHCGEINHIGPCCRGTTTGTIRTWDGTTISREPDLLRSEALAMRGLTACDFPSTVT